MMRLLLIEARRMWSRRLPWVLVLLVTGGMLLVGVVTFATSKPDKPDMSEFEAQLKEDVAYCRTSSIEEWNEFNAGNPMYGDVGYEEYLGQFESAEAYADESCNPAYFSYYVEDPRFCLISLYEPDSQWRYGCPDIDMTTAEGPRVINIVAGGVEYRTAKPAAVGTIPVTSLLLFGVAAVVGASFIGAEYAAGTVETTLLWETRRRRILGAKITVAAVTAAVIHIILLSFLVLVLVPSALWRGSTSGVDAEFWWGLVAVVLRGGVAAGAVAALALCVSTLTRNTVGGVVALLGYIAVSPALGATVLRSLRQYDLTENLGAFANGGEVARFIRGNDGYLEAVFAHGGGIALVMILAYVAVAVAVAMVVFSRRDID